jgi:hypothetical protein
MLPDLPFILHGCSTCLGEDEHVGDRVGKASMGKTTFKW